MASVSQVVSRIDRVSTIPERAQLLIGAVQGFSKAESLAEIIDLATKLARVGTGADGVSFVLRDREQCYYVNEDAIGPLWKGRRFDMSACVSGWCMRHRLAVIIPDVTKDDRVPLDAYLPTFVRSMVMVPIRSSDPIGAIGAYWAETNEPTGEAAHWLQALADAASAGISAVQAAAESSMIAARLPRAPARDELVSVCAWTQRVLFEGEWISFEAYLRARFGLMVTHGICPSAQKRLMSEFPDDSEAGAVNVRTGLRTPEAATLPT